MTKSGCCWHQFSEFKVIENEPVPVRIVEESISNTTGNFFVEVTEIGWENGKEILSSMLMLPYEIG